MYVAWGCNGAHPGPGQGLGAGELPTGITKCPGQIWAPTPDPHSTVMEKGSLTPVVKLQAFRHGVWGPFPMGVFQREGR